MAASPVERLHAVVDGDRQRCASRRECCRPPSASRRTRPACGRRRARAPTRCRARRAAARRGAEAVQRRRPQHRAASRTSGEIASKARWMGCTANGRLMMMEATSMPANVNTSGSPTSLRQALDRRMPAHRDQQVEAQHRRRQHQRQRPAPRPGSCRESVRQASARASRSPAEAAEGSGPERELQGEGEGGPVHRLIPSLRRHREAVARQHRARLRPRGDSRRTRAPSRRRPSSSAMPCSIGGCQLGGITA